MQVLWLGLSECDVTWEPSGKVPPALIADFEKGNSREVTAETSTSYGKKNTVLVSDTSLRDSHGPPQKKTKAERFVATPLSTG